MRIIQFSDSFLPIVDGVGNVVYHYALNLGNKGHEVYVVAPQTDTGYRGGYPFEIVDYAPLPLLRVKNYTVGMPALDKHCQNRLGVIQADIVHVHSPFITGQAGISYAQKNGLPLVGTRHMPAPYTLPGLDAIAYMEAVLADDHAGASKPAAIIVETTQAEGGIQVLPTEFLVGLRDLCTRHGIVMIVDDIQVGCWRTGTFFSFERAGIKPDIVTLSKSLGGIGTPFAVTLVSPDLDVLGPGEHNGTFRGNQLGMVAAKAAIDFALDTDFVPQLQEKGALAKELVEGIAAKHGVEARGIGMIWALELGDGALVKDAIHRLFDRGVICEACGRGDSALKLMPALVTPNDVLREGMAAIDEVLGEVLGR